MSWTRAPELTPVHAHHAHEHHITAVRVQTVLAIIAGLFVAGIVGFWLTEGDPIYLSDIRAEEAEEALLSEDAPVSAPAVENEPVIAELEPAQPALPATVDVAGVDVIVDGNEYTATERALYVATALAWLAAWGALFARNRNVLFSRED